MAKRHVGKEVKKKTDKKAKEATPKITKKMQVVVDEKTDGDDFESEDEDDVDNVDEHVDNDDDGLGHDDDYDYAGLHHDVQNAMHINDEDENDENENEENEDEEALLQRIVNEDKERREMMFEVSISGKHALITGVTQYEDIVADEEQQNNETEEAMADKLDGAYKELEDCYNKMSTLLKESKIEYPNNLLVHIKYSHYLTLLENMSKIVDENAKEIAAEREKGKNEGEVEKEVKGEKEVEIGVENEEEGEEEMAGIQNAIEVETVGEKANEGEGEGEGKGEEECDNSGIGVWTLPDSDVSHLPRCFRLWYFWGCYKEGEREGEGEAEGERGIEREVDMAGEQNAEPSTATTAPIYDDDETTIFSDEDINENDIERWDCDSKTLEYHISRYNGEK
ncbi:neurofilament light polypeptide-like [Helianthus annuus]|uniref:neurofilament light polypeptide-like n=1 Tax=Helianthus annuus TaxID=4232 RepID=UPI001652DBD4|nr:neurofilament light polypeptide-like [Helianthus annuus]